MNAPEVTYNVARRFQELRQRYLLVRIGMVVAGAAIGFMLLWMALAWGDYQWEWSITWRTVGWVALASVVFVGLVWQTYRALRDTRQRKFAAQLEHSFDEFGQRIRTVLDTVDGRVRGPTEMLAALGHQTLGRWETSSPAQLIPVRTLACMVLASLVLLLIVAVTFVAGGDFRTAMLRALGSEIPYTTLEVTPGNQRLLEGTPVEVSIDLHGRTERDVALRYRRLSNEEQDQENASASDSNKDASKEDEPGWIESTLTASDDDSNVNGRRARFAAELGKANEPIEYQFVTSVGTTELYRITVQPMIQATMVETAVSPPDYTRLEDRTFAASSVTVLENSEVQVTIQTNHPLTEANLMIGPKTSKLESVDVEPGDRQDVWTFNVPSTRSSHWRFSGAGRDGTPMTPVKGRLRVRRDSAPGVVWRDPPSEIRVHTLAELPMQVQVSDDYGITESGIVFQLGGEDDFVLTDWFADDSEDQSTNTTRVRLEEVLPLESLALSERDFISYYAYAIDNRADAAHRAESEIRYIDIRPLRQFYLEIEQDPNNAGNRVLIQLDEIIRRQRFLINRTRRLVRSSNVDMAAQLGTIDRLVESQSELAGLTRFLADFFAQRGNDDAEALNQAEAAMLQAADSLSAGSFDLALVQQEDALRALAEARRTLEIALLKNPSLQQQQQLQRLARQIRQRLRRERPETEQQIADSLQRIAAEQQQLGEMAQQLNRDAQQPTGSGGAGTSEQTNPQPSNSPTGGTAAEPSPESDPASEGANQPSEPSESDDEGDASQSPEPNEGLETEESTLEERRDQLFARQTDLLERVDAIREQLADRLATSPLMAERMDEVTASIDDLASRARAREYSRYESTSDDVSEQLREIGVQLDALAASEPVSRISALRDMTASLASMESEFAQQLTAQQSESTSQNTSQGQGNADAARMARRMQRRTETIEEILRTPAEVGDVETSEVNDMLARFAEDNDFLDQLAATREAAQRLAEGMNEDESGSDGEPDVDDIEAGLSRAVDYVEGSRMLDELYRQLVTPRLARLRRLEQQAGQLSQQLGQNQRGESDQETNTGIRVLQNQLNEEGLGELAELLDARSGEESDTEMRSGSELGNGSQQRIGNASGNLARNLALVSAELQERIQEMVLLEISADRDAPVPAEYREEVDRYFRALAGESSNDKPANRDMNRNGGSL